MLIKDVIWQPYPAVWDGSSKFQKDNRWGAFPSMALAWRISEEDFAKELSWISNLKLRASIGLTGNNANVGPYDTQSLAGTKYWYNYGGAPAYGYGINGITNTLLTWEKTREIKCRSGLWISQQSHQR